MPDLPTTPAGFAERALTHAPADRRAQLDPISMTILLAILGQCCVELVGRCWDKLWPRKMAHVNAVDRYRLRNGVVWRACGKVSADPQFTGQHGGQHDLFDRFADVTHHCLLTYGAAMTEGEAEQLRSLRTTFSP